jgi:hypothetical protein
MFLKIQTNIRKTEKPRLIPNEDIKREAPKKS